jgi:hypothetical protein
MTTFILSVSIALVGLVQICIYWPRLLRSICRCRLHREEMTRQADEVERMACSAIAMRLVSYEKIGNCTYRVVTESKKYGRVIQNVLILPESAFETDRNEDTPKET